MKCENWESCKSCIDLVLKFVFVAVFTWGVVSAVCCMKSCSSKTSCCKSGTTEAVKPCSASAK